MTPSQFKFLIFAHFGTTDAISAIQTKVNLWPALKLFALSTRNPNAKSIKSPNFAHSGTMDATTAK